MTDSELTQLGLAASDNGELFADIQMPPFPPTESLFRPDRCTCHRPRKRPRVDFETENARLQVELQEERRKNGIIRRNYRDLETDLASLQRRLKESLKENEDLLGQLKGRTRVTRSHDRRPYRIVDGEQWRNDFILSKIKNQPPPKVCTSVESSGTTSTSSVTTSPCFSRYPKLLDASALK